MALSRRHFLKAAAGSGLLLAGGAQPGRAAGSAVPAPEAVGILYDATLCIGCNACMVSCKQYNTMPGGALEQEDGSLPYEHITPAQIYDAPVELSARTLNIIKAYKSGRGTNKDSQADGYSFIKQHCMHCLEPACVSVCPVAALQKAPDSGIVFYEAERCIGCRYCQVACPFGIPKFEWGKTAPRIRKCQLCRHRYAKGGYAACCEFCPTGASLFGPLAALRREAKNRLAATPGSAYDFPVRTVDSGVSQRRPVSRYIDQVYGLAEAGGTQYLLMAGVPFELLGLNPAISEQAYPQLTWDYIRKVPALVAVLIAAGVASHMITRQRAPEKAP